MRPSPRFLHLAAALALVVAVPACGPANTASTFTPGAVGMAAQVSHGTIIGSRPVQIQGGGSGIGGAGGALAGGLAGSTIGGDWRANMLAGVGGALVGGLAGSAVERGMNSGTAMEFVVREDSGGDIAVVQTNEESLQVGDRVMITRGDRVRLTRTASAPPSSTRQ
jgi:outer membrane lipoprotein SlyB